MRPVSSLIQRSGDWLLCTLYCLHFWRLRYWKRLLLLIPICISYIPRLYYKVDYPISCHIPDTGQTSRVPRENTTFA